MANYATNRLTVTGPNLDAFLAGMRDGDFPKKFVSVDSSSIFMDEFETRHAPPFKLLIALGKRNPKLIFCLSFYGEDGEHGRILIKDGEWVDKESYLHHATGSRYEEMLVLQHKEYITHDKWVAEIRAALPTQSLVGNQEDSSEAWDEATLD